MDATRTALIVLGLTAAAGNGGLWITDAELAALPTSGPAWANVVDWAAADITPNISDQDNQGDVATMARGLVYARTGDETFRAEVVARCLAAMETENGGRTLALGRNLIGYVIAADLVGWTSPAWEDWLNAVRFEDLDGRTLVSTHEDRPNNWGTHAGASRVAVALFLGDFQELQAAAEVWRGWTGELDAYAGHEFSDPYCWHSSPDGLYRGINPAGSAWDGILPDDQRRSGLCPPDITDENYVREALQGAIASMLLLERAGFTMGQWADAALLRVALRREADGFAYPGDDEWEPWAFNWAFGLDLDAEAGAQPGKNVGFTDYTHAAGRPGPSCIYDLDGNGSVATADMLILLGAWEEYGAAGFLGLLGSWGPC